MPLVKKMSEIPFPIQNARHHAIFFYVTLSYCGLFETVSTSVRLSVKLRNTDCINLQTVYVSSLCCFLLDKDSPVLPLWQLFATDQVFTK
jgi:hypothetical protein